MNLTGSGGWPPGCTAATSTTGASRFWPISTESPSSYAHAAATAPVQMAAHLLGVRSTGVSCCHLLRMGVPLPVCRLLDAATPRPFEPLDQRWAPPLRPRWTALLYAAKLADDCRSPRPVSGEASPELNGDTGAHRAGAISPSASSAAPGNRTSPKRYATTPETTSGRCPSSASHDQHGHTPILPEPSSTP